MLLSCISHQSMLVCSTDLFFYIIIVMTNITGKPCFLVLFLFSCEKTCQFDDVTVAMVTETGLPEESEIDTRLIVCPQTRWRKYGVQWQRGHKIASHFYSKLTGGFKCNHIKTFWYLTLVWKISLEMFAFCSFDKLYAYISTDGISFIDTGVIINACIRYKTILWA